VEETMKDCGMYCLIESGYNYGNIPAHLVERLRNCKECYCKECTNTYDNCICDYCIHCGNISRECYCDMENVLKGDV